MTKPYYLKLTNSRKIRIVWNKETEQKFTELTGKKMVCFAEFSANISELISFCWCAAEVGEKEEGRTLGMTEKQLMRLIDASAMWEFANFCATFIFSEN